jgi:hypothetical protein
MQLPGPHHRVPSEANGGAEAEASMTGIVGLPSPTQLCDSELGVSGLLGPVLMSDKHRYCGGASAAYILTMGHPPTHTP